MIAIVGNATQIVVENIPGGITSISYSLSPSTNPLWQLGSYDAYDIEIEEVKNVSLQFYGNVSEEIILEPSTSCVDSTAKLHIYVNPATCFPGQVSVIDEDFFINSYSYSKDYRGFGQESLSLQSKPILQGYVGSIFLLQGIATGNHLTGLDIVSNDGITLIGSRAGDPYDATGIDISLSAGNLSIGEYGRKLLIKLL